MTTHDMAYLDDIRGWSAYYLAGEAGVSSPSGRDTHGARMLIELRDEVVEAWESGLFDFTSTRNDSDVYFSLARDTVTHESYAVFAAWTDLCVWSNDWPDGWGNGEHRSGSVEDMVRDSLDEMLCAYAASLVASIRKAFEAWVCPECGDTGSPRICYPGDCRSTEEAQEAYRASQATSDAPEAVSDPILTLIAQVEAEAVSVAAEAVSKPTDTQQFMARMEGSNQAEFGERRDRRRFWITWWALLATSAVVATLMLAGVL